MTVKAWPWSVLLSSAVLGTLATLAARVQQPAPQLQTLNPTEPCRNDLVFKTEYQRESNSIVKSEKGYAFNGLSWLVARPCDGGVLHLELSGMEANNELPRMVVSINDRTVASLAAGPEEKSVNVQIPEGGVLRLAYLNDYYLSEFRAAYLKDFSFAGQQCSSLKALALPPSAPAHWETSTVLTSPAPLTFLPCGAGQLQFQLVGQAAGGQFPEVVVTQYDRILQTSKTGTAPRLVSLTVRGEPVSIRLTNPYFKELGDRNLFLHDWSFTPRGDTYAK